VSEFILEFLSYKNIKYKIKIKINKKNYRYLLSYYHFEFMWDNDQVFGLVYVGDSYFSNLVISEFLEGSCSIPLIFFLGIPTFR
jgi:hypothetical protein